MEGYMDTEPTGVVDDVLADAIRRSGGPGGPVEHDPLDLEIYI